MLDDVFLLHLLRVPPFGSVWYWLFLVFLWMYPFFQFAGIGTRLLDRARQADGEDRRLVRALLQRRAESAPSGALKYAIWMGIGFVIGGLYGLLITLQSAWAMAFLLLSLPICANLILEQRAMTQIRQVNPNDLSEESLNILRRNRVMFQISALILSFFSVVLGVGMELNRLTGSTF